MEAPVRHIELADLDYGVPEGVDILFGAKVFSKGVLHGWRYSPEGAPSAFKVCFGCLLNGEVNDETQQPQPHICGNAFANSKGVYKGTSAKKFRW